MFVCLWWGLTSQSTIFQSCRDGATASWVINQYFRGVKCLAQGHNTAAVGIEPPTSRSGVRHSTTEPPHVSWTKIEAMCRYIYPTPSMFQRYQLLYDVIIIEFFSGNTIEPPHDKTNKMTCAPSEDRSAWVSAQPDQSLRCPHEESLGP